MSLLYQWLQWAHIAGGTSWHHVLFQLCHINVLALLQCVFAWGTVLQWMKQWRHSGLRSIILPCIMTQSVTWPPSVSKGGTHSAGDPEWGPLMRWNRLTSPLVWSGMKNKCHGGWQRASVSYQPGHCEWWLLSAPLLRGCLLSQGGRVVLGREEDWEPLRDPSLRRSPSPLIWPLHG